MRPEHAGRTIRCGCGREHLVPGGAPRRRPLAVSRRIARLLAILSWGWLVGVIGAAIMLWGFGDRWWPGTLLLFGPRWPLLIPAPILLVAVLLVRPRLALALALGVVIVVGPILGFRTGWRGWFAGGPAATLRVITFNMRGSVNPLAYSVPAALVEYQPDLVMLQECAAAVDQLFAVPGGWRLRRHGGLCVLSRWPIDSAVAIEVLRAGVDGMSGLAVHYLVRVDGQPVSLVNLHLETPRRGIEGFRWGGEVSGLTRSIAVRDEGSRRTANWIARQAPGAIIAGDFNLPVESAIFRRHWGSCRNAFSERGRGFGDTRVLPKWSARIDHVLACDGAWQPVAATVGPDLGSDHLPLIVDLRRR